jgi:hypothetical protein
VLPDYLKVNLPSKKPKEPGASTDKTGFSHLIKQSSTKKLVLTEVFSSSTKVGGNERLITTSTQAKTKPEHFVSGGITYSYGNIANAPTTFARPTKFCKSFKKSSKTDLLVLENTTPKASSPELGLEEGVAHSTTSMKPQKLSPKSVKSKFNLSKGFVADRSMHSSETGLLSKPKCRIATERLFIDEIPGHHHSQDGASTSYTDVKERSRGHLLKDTSIESPLKDHPKIKMVDRSKSKFYYHKLSLVESQKTSGTEVTDKGTPKQKNKHFVPGSRLDHEGITGEDKHRDYKLNNMFKMIEFLEKDQNLTSNRLELRVKSD